MARFKDREKALTLRKQEMSYSQIKRVLNVSKGTLSIWLKDYPLSEKRVRDLRDHNEQRIERCRETKRKKKEKRLRGYYIKQKKLIFPLTKREFFLAGLFLYWGEGSKTAEANISVSNTDPAIIKLFIKWLIICLDVPREKIRIQLHLYSDMDIDKEVAYWQKTLNLAKNQFRKSYIKKSLKSRINHKGSFGHGTCSASIGGARLAERIHVSIKAITDKYL